MRKDRIMTLDDIFKLAGAIIFSLGGGAAIVTAVAKWCGDLLAQKLLADFEHKHEMKIEKYRTELQNMSTEFNSLLNHSMQVASKQYDVEVEIYQKIWISLHELSLCQNFVVDFENATRPDLDDYITMLKNHCNDLSAKLNIFREQIDSAAPFYQEEAYNLLYNIEREYSELLIIMSSSIISTGMSIENQTRVRNELFPTIKTYKDELIKTIREYLLSLKKVPNRK